METRWNLKRLVLGLYIFGYVLFVWIFTAEGVPFLLSVIFSPLYPVRLVNQTGLVGIAWLLFLALFATLACNENRNARAFAPLVIAVLVGALPHVVFIWKFNGASSYVEQVKLSALIRQYELFVIDVQEGIGPFLVPSLLVATALSVLLVRLTLAHGQFGLYAKADKLRGLLSFFSLALAAASSLTLFSALPTDSWRPDALHRLNAQLKTEAQQRITLSVYEILKQDIQENSEEAKHFLATIRQSTSLADDAARELMIGDYEDRRNAAMSMAVESLKGAHDFSQEASFPLPAGLSSNKKSTDLIAESIERSSELERRFDIVRNEVSALIGQTVGGFAESLVGPVLASVVEQFAAQTVGRLLDEAPAEKTRLVAEWFSSSHPEESINAYLRTSFLAPLAALSVSKMVSSVVSRSREIKAEFENAQRERIKSEAERARPRGRR